MNHIFGIDLGTTNSCIARLHEGRPEAIEIDGSAVVPSVVNFDNDQSIIVGRRALNRAVLYPEATVLSNKRNMGSDQPLSVQGKDFSPETISSYILGYLKTEAEKACGVDVKRVVITVPAYFSDAQRRATIKAGELAGLHVERIINEPTAAALFYEHLGPESGRQHEEYALVYDLGGGTFDVSVLRLGELSEILASTGNTRLGGDDFDRKLIDRFLEHLQTQFHEDLRDYRPALARLKPAAEKAKIELSIQVYTRVEELLIPNKENKQLDLNLELNRNDLEMLLQDYLDSTAAEVDKALQEAGLEPKDIDKVLLVGGSTRIPAVIRLLEDSFGASRMPAVDPDLCVAKGAAIQGGIISGSHCHQVLIDVTSHTLSTEALVDQSMDSLACVPIIPRNTQIPVTRSELFATVVPGQSSIEVKVFQGESKRPEENTLIGALDLSLVPAPANCPVVIEYSYDLNGIIHVKVEQKGYSRKREVDLDIHKQDQHFFEMYMDRDIPDNGFQDEQEEADEYEDSIELDKNITNFILQKARTVLENIKNEEDKKQLQDLIRDYELALHKDDENLVDEAEDALVDFMEELDGSGDDR